MTDDKILEIRRLRTGSVFRLVAAGTFFSIVPFFILMGVLAFFGMDSLKWNNQPVVGLKALIAAPFMGVFAAAIFTAIGGVGASCGLWLYSKIRPLSLRAVIDGSAHHAEDSSSAPRAA